MTRSVLTAAIDSDWSIVTESKPCPICGSAVGCSLHSNAEFACCAREPSDWKLTNGAWLHRVQSALRMPASGSANLVTAEFQQSGTHIRL
jgi:hypothetical protein